MQNKALGMRLDANKALGFTRALLAFWLHALCFISRIAPAAML